MHVPARLLHRWICPISRLVSSPQFAVGDGLTGAYFARLSTLGFGFTALAASFTIVILPQRILDVSASSKNTHLGVLSFVGLVIAFLVQPLAGGLSDRFQSRWGRRRPFIVAGTLASLPLVFAAALAPSYLSLFVLVCLLQLTSNTALGPYQALVRDLVPYRRRGAASGMKALVEIAGAMGLTAMVGLLVGQYASDHSDLWLWAAAAMITLGMTAGAIITTRSIAQRPTMMEEEAGGSIKPHPDFRWFVLSRLMIAVAAGSLSTYALYFLKDVLGVENPARVMGALIVVVGCSVLIVSYPAGVLADRLGRKVVIGASGVLGALVPVLLIAVHSVPQIMAVGALAGIAMGMFAGSNWAMATDLVSARRTAQHMGYLNLATAGGAGVARLNGLWVDRLNSDGSTTGYSILLGMCGILFVVATLLVLRVRANARA